MDARQSWLWILTILILKLLSTTSSELVKRQAEDKEQMQITDANLRSDESIKSTPISENDSSYKIPTKEPNKQPLDLSVQPLKKESQHGNATDSKITKPAPNKDGSTQNPPGKGNVFQPLPSMEQQTSSKSPKNTPNKSTNMSPQGLKSKDDNFVRTPDELEKNIELDIIVPKTNETAAVVREMLETIELKNSTDNYVTQFYRRYNLLPQVEADNLKWTKFARAVAEAFVLDFSRMYEEENNSSQDSLPDSDDDWEDDYRLDYNETYNLAISHLKEKKGQTALQFAVPVVRTSDIYKAVLDMPIGIVKSKCKAYMTNWQCQAEYLAQLTDESEICDHIWHHAELHLKILKTLEENKNVENPTDTIIAKLESKIKSVKTNSSNGLLNFIIKTLKKLRSQLKESLLSNAQIFNYFKDSQSKGFLQCMNIDLAL